MSSRLLRAAVVLASSWMLCPSSASADENAAAWAALRDGAVALMRHADAPGGSGDPPGFKLDDCATQRNLSTKGRADAKAVGDRIRSEGIKILKVMSSPWCRCVDTAELMDLGEVEIEPTFSNAFVLSERRNDLTAGAQKVIADWHGPEALLIVTHGANIRALTGVSPAQGEIVVVAPGRADQMEVLGRIPVPES